MKFDGKVAVVTGAGSKRGIGRETALALAGRGADVVVADMDLEGAKRVAGEIEALGRRALALPVNVTDEASVESMFAEAEKALGRVDILVNNAGITQPVTTADMTVEDFIATPAHPGAVDKVRVHLF